MQDHQLFQIMSAWRAYTNKIKQAKKFNEMVS
jgi:hypothetical protein